MVILEVAQARMSAWSPEKKSGNYPESQGIYLEVYPKIYERASCGCFSLCGCKKRHDSKAETYVNTTSLVPESQKMLWRKYNEDNFLVALFTLGDDCWPFRTGDQLELVADVYRQPVDPEQRGDKVLTMTGSLWVGFWGPVFLAENGNPPTNDSDDDHRFVPKLRLDFRPMSTRPFVLEFARPQQAYEDVDTLRTRAIMKKIKQQVGVQKESSLRSSSFSGLKKRSRGGEDSFSTQPMAWPTQPMAWPTDPKSWKMRTNKGGFEMAQSTDSAQGRRQSKKDDDSPVGDHWTPVWSTEIDQAKSVLSSASIASTGSRDSERIFVTKSTSVGKMWNINRSFGSRNSTRSTASREKDFTRTASNSSAFSHLSMASSCVAQKVAAHSSISKWHYGQSSMEENAVMMLCSPIAGADMFYPQDHAAVSLLAATMGWRLPSSGEKDHGGARNDWVPTDWDSLWKSTWPGKGDDLRNKADVVPLMEHEFRRDCIVLFNTLFPLCAGERFAVMRELAFHPSSRIRFKPISKNHQLLRASTGSTLSRLSIEIPDSQHDGSLEECGSPKLASADSDVSSSSSSKDFGVSWFDTRNSTFTYTTSQERGVWARWRAATFRVRKCLRRVNLAAPSMLESRPNPAEHYIASAEPSFSTQITPRIFQEHRFDGEVSVGNTDALSDASSSAPTDLSVARESHGSQGCSGFFPAAATLLREEGASPRDVVISERSTMCSEFSHQRCFFNRVMRCKGDDMPARSVDEQDDAVALELGQRTPTRSESPKRLDRPWENVNVELASTVSASSEQSVLSLFSKPKWSSEGRHLCQSWGSPFSFSRSSTTGCTGGRSSSMLDALGFRTNQERISKRIISTDGLDFHDDYSQRVLFLKRLLLCYAFCGVFYTEAANSEQLGELWPYPIAAILGHGSRVLIRLEDVDATEFLNFLLTGDPHGFDWREGGVPAPLKPRLAATHSASLESETGNVVEKKLKVNAADTVQNLTDGIRKKHLGLNLPIGGVGNPSPLGNDHYIDYHGRVVRLAKRASAITMVKTVSDRFTQATSKLSGGNKKGASEPTLTRKNSADSIASSVDSAPSRLSADSSRDAVSDFSSWRPIPNLQNGHLYIRIDDFGEHAGSWAGFQGDFRSSRTEEMKSSLRRKLKKTMLPLEQANLRMQVDRSANEAGELLFLEGVPRIKMNISSSGGLFGHRIFRVNSMPNLRQGSGTTSDDVRWANQWIMYSPGDKLPKKPPSPAAIQILMEHYDPISVQLYGKAHFKTMQELYDELTAMKSFLVKRGNGVQRCLESVVMELCWQGFVLMVVKEPQTPKKQAWRRELPQGPIRAYEHWQEVSTCLFVDQLNLPEDLFVDSLVSRDEWTHRVVEETLRSESFPGMYNVCRTHIVRWEVADHSYDIWQSRGLLVNLVTRARKDGPPYDFSTCTHGRTRFWQWVPLAEVGNLKAQNYNIGKTKLDDAWVKYAIHKDGIVQYPPSEAALTVLLRRTGVDITKYGKGRHKSLSDLWVELLNQASYLQMNKGKPTRVLEGMIVRIRMQPSKQQPDALRQWHVLVKREASLKDKESNSTLKLIRTNKKRGETWEDAAIRFIAEEFNCTKSKFKASTITTSDSSHYRYFEEIGESSLYPTMKTVYRFHLVTYRISEDILRFPEVRKHLQREESPEGNKSRDALKGSWSLASSKSTPDVVAPGKSRTDSPVPCEKAELGSNSTSSPTPAGWFSSPRHNKDSRSCASRNSPRLQTDYFWMDEREAETKVADMAYWTRSQKDEETHHISCVLIGLEGAAPNCKSAFGSVHDAKGSSSKVSAVGNRKWRAYRLNNALQIPSTEGGMRMKINREMFEELIDACDDIGIMDPSSDLLVNPKQGFPRPFLDQRHAEKEFFKSILGGSGRQARNAVEWMRQYCKMQRFPYQAFKEMYRKRRKN